MIAPASLHLSCDADNELVKCLIESTESTFLTMLGWDVKSCGCLTKDARIERFSISGIISITGALKATVVVNIHPNLAFSAMECLMGERPTAMNAEITDLVGELANIIGGNAKERLKLSGLTLGLPMVVPGANHTIGYDANTEVTYLPFESEHGPLTVEFVLG